ncbi:hypothetical protein IOK_04246 [Yersinia enterocolitica subsp. palearctica PhRBD_Ye1]|nr:hypothetical protein IOK_04246 [Yersinia enterocolitica subsp. palearctica PhRBD_Ye1]
MAISFLVDLCIGFNIIICVKFFSVLGQIKGGGNMSALEKLVSAYCHTSLDFVASTVAFMENQKRKLKLMKLKQNFHQMNSIFSGKD